MCWPIIGCVHYNIMLIKIGYYIIVMGEKTHYTVTPGYNKPHVVPISTPPKHFKNYGCLHISRREKKYSCKISTATYNVVHERLNCK